MTTGSRRNTFLDHYWRSAFSVPSLIVAAIGTAAILTGYLYLTKSVRDSAQARFDATAAFQVAALRSRLERNVNTVRSLGAFFDASEIVSRKEFSVFARQEVARFQGIQALSWNPVVPRRRLTDVTRLARWEGFSGYEIFEWDATGSPVTVSDRPVYIPVLYIEPVETNHAIRGFDVYTDPDGRLALEKARDTGEIVATGAVGHFRKPGQDPGILAFRPVYLNGVVPPTVSERRLALQGYAVGVFRIGDIVKAAFGGNIPSETTIEILDNSVTAGSTKRIYDSRSFIEAADVAASVDDALVREATFGLAARDWTVVIRQRLPFVDRIERNLPWAFVGFVLCCTLLAHGCLVSVQRRRSVIGHEVSSRTVDLAQETAGSAAMQAALAESEKRYRALFDNAPVGIFFSRNKDIESANVAAAKILGYPEPEALLGRSRRDLVDPAFHHEGAMRTAAVLRGEQIEPYEIEMIRADGTKCRVLAAAASTEIEGDNYVIHTFRDISKEFAARLALQESEEKYRSLIELFPDGVILTAGGRIAQVNAAGLRLYGANSEEDILGREWLDLIDETYHREVLNRRELMAQGETAEATEFLMKRVDGTTFWGVARATQITVEGSRMLMTVFQDVTREREVARALEQSEARYRSLFETAPDAFFVIQDGKIVFANARTAAMYGVELPDDLVGEDPLRFVDPPQFEFLKDRREKILAGEGQGEFFEMVHLTAGGGKIETEDASMLIDWAGRPAILCVIRDLAERKEAEKALRVSESNYRQLTELSPDAITVQDLDTVLFANEAAAELYGVTDSDELTGKDMLTFLAAEDRESVRESRKKILATGVPVIGVEQSFVNAKHERRTVISSAAAIEWDGKEVCLVVSQDITNYRRAQDELEAANMELARSNEDLEQFAYVASHDLKEPLRMVSSYCQLIADRYSDKLDDTGRQFIHYATEGALRMRTLIDDLLVFSRIGREGGEKQWLDMNVVIQDALGNLAPAIQEAGADITCADLPAVFGNQTEMVRLFQNLVGNAVKFRSEKPPRIDITCDLTETGTTIRISDNGIGIAPRHQDQVFGVFKRLHNRRKYEGTGIGLAICEKIVAQMGGGISIESEEGVGSTFVLNFPPNRE